jgi:carbonic anhydrase/acetyltransferase-like protein (isoleucine patch superfamily)
MKDIGARYVNEESRGDRRIRSGGDRAGPRLPRENVRMRRGSDERTGSRVDGVQASGSGPAFGPLVYAIHGGTPDVEQAAFIAPGAVLVGAVTLGAGTSVWFGCVLRADGGSITVGRDVNIQDGSILHADPGFPTTLGDRVSLGHGAIVHGATVENDVLIGMRATVLNGAQIGEGSLIAAGALVRPGTVVPPRSLVAGVPAVVRRLVNVEDAVMIERTPLAYFRHAEAHSAALAEHRRA